MPGLRQDCTSDPSSFPARAPAGHSDLSEPLLYLRGTTSRADRLRAVADSESNTLRVQLGTTLQAAHRDCLWRSVGGKRLGCTDGGGARYLVICCTNAVA